MELAHLWAELGSDIREALGTFRDRLGDLDVVEKGDRTLLTEADVAIQAMIVDKIQRFDPGARIVAEESSHDTWRPDSGSAPERIWVIDPIDGTAEFIRGDRVEFCSVVCLLEKFAPTNALVVAPELGIDRSPLVLTASRPDGSITVNGVPARPNSGSATARSASVTRSSGTQACPFEQVMVAAGYSLKTRTTSQTLDMVRTALDLSEMTEKSVRFDLFFRPRQKIWDGLAGLCFGATVGLANADLTGATRVLVDPEILARPEPTFESTVMGFPEAVTWFVEIAQDYPAEVQKSL